MPWRSPGCTRSGMSCSKPWRDSAQSMARLTRSATRPSESVTRLAKSAITHSRRSAPSRPSSKTRWPRSWRPRAFLSGGPWTSPRRNLQVESDELGIISAALGVIYNDLEVLRSEGTSTLMAHAVEIMARVC